MADGQKKPQRKTKGRMARELVYYCIYALTLTLAWAVVIKTVAVILDRPSDLSDVLIFAAAAFGGELLLLLCKRVFAKPNDDGGT
jgi:hypothetical protein|nr:MAG: hypothetical protein [Bacteriophage sp.]DAF17091.1 MAG TPA: hypothetical protein [Caudoviricetes sp.]DAG67039.1 MAG TPA: hypothetical protein [Caudoviricetes sp.]